MNSQAGTSIHPPRWGYTRMLEPSSASTMRTCRLLDKAVSQDHRLKDHATNFTGQQVPCRFTSSRVPSGHAHLASTDPPPFPIFPAVPSARLPSSRALKCALGSEFFRSKPEQKLHERSMPRLFVAA